MMNIVVFTGDENKGGIIQFSIAIVRAFQKMGHITHLFLPKENKITNPEDILNIYRYDKVDHIQPHNISAKNIADRVLAFHPDMVFFSDASIVSIQVMIALNKRSYACMTIHDITRHPMVMNIRNLRRMLVLTLAEAYVNLGVKHADSVVLLSGNSLQKYNQIYSSYRNKAIMFKIGAHPPVANPVKPKELDNEKEGYYLFFGRIEKYKGVLQLVKAYNSVSRESAKVPKLVIAGSGKFLQEEKHEIEKNSRIIVLNRFIDDSEMVWLFQNCSVLVAPYIEASQSGVLPIAYYYGKPVIASNIPGIQENVVTGETGTLFNSPAELEIALKECQNWNFEKYYVQCQAYLKAEMDWQTNLEKVFIEMTKTKEKQRQ